MSKTQYFYGTGKRKTSIARVKLYEHGNGEITVNEQSLKKYFYGILPGIAMAPLKLTNTEKAFNAVISVEGGGKNSQAEALRHGLSRALLVYDPQLRSLLKKAGYLTRDARIRERKKPGLKRARRAPQWQKR